MATRRLQLYEAHSPTMQGVFSKPDIDLFAIANTAHQLVESQKRLFAERTAAGESTSELLSGAAGGVIDVALTAVESTLKAGLDNRAVTASVVDQTRVAVQAAVDAAQQQERMLNRRRLFGKRRGGGGKGGGKRRGSGASGGIEESDASLQLVLGVVSNQRTPATRDWIRQTYLAEAAKLDGVVLRFVIGRLGLNPDDRKRIRAERKRHGDVEMIDASDFAEAGGIFSCIDKLFAWWPHAVRTWPNAAFYAKADDDSLVDVPRLLAMLRRAAPLQNVYAGYVQYDSFVTDEWKHCGWGANPIAAAHAHRGGCPGGGRAEGPFPFVVGAMTAMGADLARWFEGSAYVRDFVRRGRASQKERRHWDCGYSDVTLGYVLSKSNVSVSLVSFRDAMRDMTYGAMKVRRPSGATAAAASLAPRARARARARAHARADATRRLRPHTHLLPPLLLLTTTTPVQAKRFVVSHHLRDRGAFDRQRADMARQEAWSPTLHACAAWPRTTRLAETWDGDPQTVGGAELEKAMRAFGCCQQWRMCEVQPGAPDPEPPPPTQETEDGAGGPEGPEDDPDVSDVDPRNATQVRLSSWDRSLFRAIETGYW